MKIDYTIKGTNLPIIPAGTEYRVDSWDHDTNSALVSFSKENLISFGHKWYKDECYILCEREDYENSLYYMVKLSDIEKLTKIQEPMRTIKYSDAQKIVDIACLEWKELLFNSWGKDIVLKKDINIPSENYQNMRKACTEAQHKLFDDIFGEDKPQFKVGDWVIGWHHPNPTYQDKVWEIGDINPRGYFIPKNSPGYTCSSQWLRLATEEEIKAANVFPDGTPCLVTECPQESWTLRYANGKGGFYKTGRKSGEFMNWKYSMKLDMDNLPVNE